MCNVVCHERCYHIYEFYGNMFILIFCLRATMCQSCRNLRWGGAGEGPIAPSDFDRSVNLISIKGADYAHHFSSLPRIFRPSYGPVVGFRYLARGFIVVAKN